MDLVFALSCIGVAFLYGSTGVGGILLIPAMQYSLGMDLAMTTGTTLASFAIVTLEGTWMHYRAGRLKRDIVLPQCLGAAVFGCLGALAKHLTGDVALNLIFAVLVIVCGVLALRPPKALGMLKSERSKFLCLLGVGMSVGFIAGLTGVGGPVMSIPMMLMMGFPVIPTIAAAQPFSVIACWSGTIGNILLDQIDWTVCLWAVLWQAVGLFIGIRTTPYLNVNLLRTAIAVMCVLTGVIMLIR